MRAKGLQVALSSVRAAPWYTLSMEISPPKGGIEERFSQTITLYGQFGRPVAVPSTAPKIGFTVTLKRPRSYDER